MSKYFAFKMCFATAVWAAYGGAAQGHTIDVPLSPNTITSVQISPTAYYAGSDLVIYVTAPESSLETVEGKSSDNVPYGSLMGSVPEEPNSSALLLGAGLVPVEYSLDDPSKDSIFNRVELSGYISELALEDQIYDESYEAGRLYGVELMTDLIATDTTQLKLGGGYEWLDWDDSSDDSFTVNIEASQALSEIAKLNANFAIGPVETAYGGGLAFDLSNGRPDSTELVLSYSRIDWRDGSVDDQLVTFGWTKTFSPLR